MTKEKQTDYDKALHECKVETEKEFGFWDSDIVSSIFRKGCEYGREVRSKEANLVLLADGEPYATARERAMADGCEKYMEAHCPSDYPIYRMLYRQGWNDADDFEGRWINKHPENLLNRLLNEFPEIIENEVKARMADMRKKAKKNADAFASATDNISQNIADCDICSDKSLMRAEFAKAAMPALIREIYQIATFKDVAREAVIAADALIAELEKTEEP